MEIICNDYEKMHRNIIDAGKKYLENNPNIKTLVVGLSGGIDSTLVAALAREICNETGRHELIGLSIPTKSNKHDEVKRAQLAGAAFCHRFNEIKLASEHFSQLEDNIKMDLGERIRAGNLKARMRMMLLYDRAHKYYGLVLSTDNLTEYNLGFWTLHGDVGDFGLIQNLWKTEVYELANFMAEVYFNAFKREFIHWLELGNMARVLKDAIKAIPTDGLGVSESDFDQLGVDSYQEADKILIQYLTTGSKNKELEEHPIIKRHLKYAFKRNNPYNIPRRNIIPRTKPIIKDLL